MWEALAWNVVGVLSLNVALALWLAYRGRPRKRTAPKAEVSAAPASTRERPLRPVAPGSARQDT